MLKNVVIPINENLGFILGDKPITGIVILAESNNVRVMSGNKKVAEGNPSKILPLPLFRMIQAGEFLVKDDDLEKEDLLGNDMKNELSDEMVGFLERTRGYNPKDRENLRLMFESHLKKPLKDRFVMMNDTNFTVFRHDFLANPSKYMNVPEGYKLAFMDSSKDWKEPYDDFEFKNLLPKKVQIKKYLILILNPLLGFVPSEGDLDWLANSFLASIWANSNKDWNFLVGSFTKIIMSRFSILIEQGVKIDSITAIMKGPKMEEFKNEITKARIGAINKYKSGNCPIWKFSSKWFPSKFRIFSYLPNGNNLIAIEDITKEEAENFIKQLETQGIKGVSYTQKGKSVVITHKG